jgi:DNA-binding response OmpR family regulator
MHKVLVVEGEPDIARIIAMVLTRRGYRVDRAAEGRSGLRMAYDLRPDLLVLDIGLPGMDGFSVLQRVLLNTLTKNAGAALSTGQLLTEAWDDPTGIGTERVKFTVLRLRRKLGWDTKASPIESVRGVGYRYRSPRHSRLRAGSGVSGTVGR